MQKNKKNNLQGSGIIKKIIKIITIFILAFAVAYTFNANAAIDGLESVQGINNITDHSIKNINNNGDLDDNIKDVGFNILTIIKYVLSALLVIFLVYAGIQMVISMGSDEEKLSEAKRQIRYTLVGLIFINIPGTLYQIFVTNKGQIDGSIHGTWYSQLSKQEESVFINIDLFDKTINGGIVMFIEYAIFWIAIIMIIYAGIRILTSRGVEEKVTEAKNKIIWSIVGLVFVGFIEAWQSVVYSGKVEDGANLFETVQNLALFFAGPVAIFFLTLAGWYYITSNGDEEKTKKAKNIIISVFLATLILLASYAFLKDLITLNI